MDLALFCRVIEPWAIRVARRVLKCPRILAEQPLNVWIADRDDECVAQIEAERIEVTHILQVSIRRDLLERQDVAPRR